MSTPLDATTCEIDQSLLDAQRAMEAFHVSVDRSRLLGRVRHFRPMHPMLLASRLANVLALSAVASAVVWMAAVAVGVPVPATLLALEAAVMPTPVALAVFAAATAAIGVCARELAVFAGESSPMLPDEAKQFQRLQGRLHQQRARRALRSGATAQ